MYNLIPYPFHTMTLARAIGSENNFLDSGPQSKPIQPSGTPSSTVAELVLAFSSNLSAVTKSTGK